MQFIRTKASIIATVLLSFVAMAAACQASQGVDEDMIRRVSNKFNLKLPINADSDTRLDSTLAGPGKRWTFIYTLVNTKASELTEAQLRSNLQTNVRNGVCTSKETQVLVENGVTIVMKYRDRDGTFIGEIVTDAGSCASR